MKTVISTNYRDSMRRAYLAWALALIGALFLPATGIGEPVDRQLQNFRATVLEKPASGEIAIVEIDAKSLQTLDSWPWPREYYAGIVAKATDAGVEQIAFDVDFSAKSSLEQDSILAEALEDTQTSIILPTFKQEATSGVSEFVESLPIAILRKNALLASVNVDPDEQGQLNNYGYGTITGGIARPSLAAMLAERPGNISEKFVIDQSIDLTTIPRYSFVDILNGDLSGLDLEGKKLLVGGTAIELGDRYPINRYGVLPGVVIQALATETLIQGTDALWVAFWFPLAFAAALLLLWLRSRWSRPERLTPAVSLLGIALFCMLLASEYAGLFTFSYVPILAFLVLFLIVGKSFNTALELKASVFAHSMSNLPNEAAMEKVLEQQKSTHVAIARLTNFRELFVLTDKASRMKLFDNLSERLKFLAADGQIFHLDPDVLGWVIEENGVENIADHFETAAALFQSPIMAGDTRVKLNATFGVSLDNIDKAKVASEQAGNSGHRWSWHNDNEATAMGTKLSLLAEIDQAIENRDIWVAYQPKWSFAEERVLGAEALVRWSHPVRGAIGPDMFIPILEQAGRIDALSLYVLQTTLDDFSRWQSIEAPLSCSVNISAKLLTDQKFVDSAIAAVDSAGIDNDMVVFEITETAALADLEGSIAALTRLRVAGIKISIDDYGTGQSTLSYIQRLPVDELKIDQGFVKTMTTNVSNRLVVKSTIELAHELHLSVVAEGIEDLDCMEMLRQLKCDVGQGWHIAKALAPADFEADWIAPSEAGNQARAQSG